MIRWFGCKAIANYTPVVPFGFKASLIPVSVLGHPIFNSNRHAFRVQPEALGDAMHVQPDALGDAMHVARCERLAGDDRRIGPVCKPCGPEGTVAVRALSSDAIMPLEKTPR